MPYVYKHRLPPEPWRQFRLKAKHPVLIPFFAFEYSFEWIAFGLSKWSFLEVLDYAGSFSILIAVIFWFAESGARTEARHYQAWQVINTAQGKGGSGGRIEALQALNDDHIPLVGVDVSLAFLQGVHLEHADLRRGTFHATDFKGSQLSHANLELADLQNANLRESDLSRSNFRDANLKDVDLSNANLDGAALDRANLSEADLADVVNWRNASWDGANISAVEHPPEGFVEWALSHGAFVEKPTTNPTAATAPSH
jgi:hypothetical protein